MLCFIGDQVGGLSHKENVNPNKLEKKSTVGAYSNMPDWIHHQYKCVNLNASKTETDPFNSNH